MRLLVTNKIDKTENVSRVATELCSEETESINFLSVRPDAAALTLLDEREFPWVQENIINII